MFFFFTDGISRVYVRTLTSVEYEVTKII